MEISSEEEQPAAPAPKARGRSGPRREVERILDATSNRAKLHVKYKGRRHVHRALG